MSVTGVVIAVTTFALLSVASSYLVYKSKRAQKIIEGAPLVVVEGGKLVEANLSSERMTLDDVMEEAAPSRSRASTRSSGPFSSRTAHSASSRTKRARARARRKVRRLGPSRRARRPLR
jgi:hypothetical protein